MQDISSADWQYAIRRAKDLAREHRDYFRPRMA